MAFKVAQIKANFFFLFHAVYNQDLRVMTPSITTSGIRWAGAAGPDPN